MRTEREMTDRKDDRLWGGRFENAPNAEFDAFQRSFSFDSRLLPFQLAVDRAWARGLRGAQVLSHEELRQILTALDGITERVNSDPAWVEKFGAEVEDVHHFAEKAVVDALGPVGWKLYTGRSRNELVATEFRLFVFQSAGQVKTCLFDLLRVFLKQAETCLPIPMAGMTHMQFAQPILLSHFLLAHAEAFYRDCQSVQDAIELADYCPMGSGALAGCAFPIDRLAIAKDLGFSRITANSLDAVSDRDFALYYLFALSTIATHLSRLAEDFVIFASQPFSYLVLPDEFSTGSSLMPQKKNPDAWELIRGKCGRVISSLFTLFTVLKGLPSSYQRDLQEDKEVLFLANEQVQSMLMVAAGALGTTKFREDRLRKSLEDPALLATEAADYLVRAGTPFREAHDLVGKLLREAERQGIPWTKLSVAEARKISPLFGQDFFADPPSVESAIAFKSVPGGTAENSVRSAIEQFEQRLRKLEINEP
jgi:argininosuccinate lyase